MSQDSQKNDRLGRQSASPPQPPDEQQGTAAAPVWHTLSVEDATTALGVNPVVGLSTDGAAERASQYGANELEEGHRVHPIVKFLHQFTELDTLGIDKPETKCKAYAK